MAHTLHSLQVDRERALLLGLDFPQPEASFSAQESLDELALLSETAGLIVVDKDIQRLAHPVSGSYFGTGKVATWQALIAEKKIQVVVVDSELKPNQQRYLESTWNLKVIDRTTLILDIFAQRARTSAAQLQIELAQLDYLYPRLTRMWAHFGQQKGGIGLRGPGETQLEVDKRANRIRVAQIKKRLEKVGKHRGLHRSLRQSVPVPVLSLVGYTNAGKSTLFNRLTEAGVLAEDKLFATLDPTTRHYILPNKQKILLSDTVGFIQKLPHSLVTAFHATLEEVAQADLLLHVVDASHIKGPDMVLAVDSVLSEIGAAGKPTIMVANKSDIGFTLQWRAFIKKLNVPFCGISAQTGEGIDKLLELIAKSLEGFRSEQTFFVPHAKGSVLAQLMAKGSLKVSKSDDAGVWLQGWVEEKVAKQFREYVFV